MSIDTQEGGKRLPVGQRPLLPGSPGSPIHPLPRKIAYGAVGVLVGLTGGLGNAMITVNLPQLQGTLGLYSYEIAWLPTVYAMTYVCSSLLLIKLRIEFGARPFGLLFTALYALTTFAHLFVGGFTSALLVRAASGVAAAALNSLTIYYVMQAAPASWRIKSVSISLGIPLLTTSLARLFSTDLLGVGEWRALYCFELGLALLSFAAVLIMPLPPSERNHTFERLDFVTFPLLAIGFALLCAVLGLGKAVWWTDAPWIGWALATSLPLIIGALAFESYRARPLLVTRWLASADILRFIVVSIMFKIVSAEQTSGAVGLLNGFGLDNDQLHPLFMIVLVASALGSVVSGVLMTPDKTNTPIMLAIFLVAVASFADFGASNLTRPGQFYITQGVIAFSAALFLGPSLLLGLGNALTKGPSYIVSFVGLFGVIQTIGGLAGSALITSFQVIREKAHSSALVQHLALTNPLVAERVEHNGSVFASTIGDPAIRGAEGLALLSRQTALEANVLAYNDVFLLTVGLAAMTTLYLLWVVAKHQIVGWGARRRAAYTQV